MVAPYLRGLRSLASSIRLPSLINSRCNSAMSDLVGSSVGDDWFRVVVRIGIGFSCYDTVCYDWHSKEQASNQSYPRHVLSRDAQNDSQGTTICHQIVHL